MWVWLKIKQEGQTAGFGPCFHLPGQPIFGTEPSFSVSDSALQYTDTHTSCCCFWALTPPNKKTPRTWLTERVAKTKTAMLAFSSRPPCAGEATAPSCPRARSLWARSAARASSTPCPSEFGQGRLGPGEGRGCCSQLPSGFRQMDITPNGRTPKSVFPDSLLPSGFCHFCIFLLLNK